MTTTLPGSRAELQPLLVEMLFEKHGRFFLIIHLVTELADKLGGLEE